MKRMIAEIVAKCISNSLDSIIEVYYLDLHGGEPANIGDYGGKDIDLAVIVDNDCSDLEWLEECLEASIRNIFEELYGINLRLFVGIPNIIEIHPVKHGNSDYQRLLHSYAPPILLASRSQD